MDDGRQTFILLIGAILLVLWVISVNAYSSLPSRIPVHFDWNGAPNRWADKTPFQFFALPGIATLLSVFLMIISRFPRLYNFPQKMEVNSWPIKKRQPVYALLNKMMYWIGLIIAGMFLFIQMEVIEGEKSQNLAPGKMWPMWILVAVMVAMPIYYLVRVSQLVKEIRGKLVQK
jgi:uncharacterized membrane protein